MQRSLVGSEMCIRDRRGRDDFVLRRESGGLAARLVARPGASPSRREAKFVRGRGDFVLRRESGGLAARLVARPGASPGHREAKFVRGRDDSVLRRESGARAARLPAEGSRPAQLSLIQLSRTIPEQIIDFRSLGENSSKNMCFLAICSRNIVNSSKN